MNTGVYKITNTVNGKIYIGSTAKSFRHRWGLHKLAFKQQKGNSLFQNAWNKYGAKAFIFEVVEECEKSVCLEREQYWLDFYKSYQRKVGYNINIKAESRLGIKVPESQIFRKYRNIHCFDFNGNLLKIYPTTVQIREEGLNHQSVLSCLVGILQSYNQMLWSLNSQVQPYNPSYLGSTGRIVKQETRVKMSQNRLGIKRPEIGIPVVQIHNGIPIKIWSTITEAAEYLQGQRSNIVAVLKNKRPSAAGFQWSYL